MTGGRHAGIAWLAGEAAGQRDAARTQLARASAAIEFLEFLLTVAAPAEGGFTVTELLAQGEELADKQFRDDDALRAELLLSIGSVHYQAELFDRARPPAARAVEIAAADGEPALLARALCFESQLLIFDGAARPNAEAAVARALSLLTDADEHRLARAECLTSRAPSATSPARASR